MGFSKDMESDKSMFSSIFDESVYAKNKNHGEKKMNPTPDILTLLGSFANLDIRALALQAINEINRLRAEVENHKSYAAVQQKKAEVANDARKYAEAKLENAERDVAWWMSEAIRWKRQAASEQPSAGSITMTDEQWKDLVLLAHPDRHGGSEKATKVMAWLNGIRPRKK